MASLNDLRNEFSGLLKKHSASQTSQFKEIKKDILQQSTLLEELKAENHLRWDEVDGIKVKVSRLESMDSSSQTASVVTQVMQESFERDRCSSNVLVYRIPESSSTPPAQRISDDKATFDNKSCHSFQSNCLILLN